MSQPQKTSGWSVSMEPLTVGLTVLGAFARLIPHPPNFVPVGGMSLFAGSRMRGWRAYLVPLLLMAVTDPILSAIYGYPTFHGTSAFVYGSLLVTVWIGQRLLREPTPGRIALAASLSSGQFFLVTNLGVWLVGGLYPHTAAGLVACFVAAIPFFGRTLASDLLYSGLLFGLYAWTSRIAPGDWRWARNPSRDRKRAVQQPQPAKQAS